MHADPRHVASRVYAVTEGLDSVRCASLHVPYALMHANWYQAGSCVSAITDNVDRVRCAALHAPRALMRADTSVRRRHCRVPGLQSVPGGEH